MKLVNYYEDKDECILLLYGDRLSVINYSLSYYNNVLSKYVDYLYIKSDFLTVEKGLEDGYTYIQYTFDLSYHYKLSDLKYLFKALRCISKTKKWIKKWGLI